MKKLATILSVLLLGTFLVAGSAMALPFNSNRPLDVPDVGGIPGYAEDSLQTILDATFGTGTIDDEGGQSNAALWTYAEADMDSYLVKMIKGDQGTFGIYNPYGTAIDITLKSSGSAGFQFWTNGTLLVDDASGETQYLNFGSTFGFYWKNTTTPLTSYTEDSKNSGLGYGPDSNILALSYLIPDGTSVTLPNLTSTASGDNDWVLAFEDRKIGDVWGDGDFNDAVFYIEDMKPVPEPATMLLLGTGLMGIAAATRRRRQKK